MRIDKNKLRQILVEHCNENGLPDLMYVKEKPWLLDGMKALLRKGRREKHTVNDYIARQLNFCVTITFASLGFEVSEHQRKGMVCVRMLSIGKVHTWIHIPKDIAEKILVFGEVPNLRAS